jgi:hypothetical protein
MREECKHFQSRTYSTGEVARFCELDLAPEAPWRCPEDCSAYAPRLADAGWVHGSLVEPPVEDEPEGEGVAELLDQAEDIVNAVVPEALAEAERKRASSSPARGGRRRWPWRRG